MCSCPLLTQLDAWTARQAAWLFGRGATGKPDKDNLTELLLTVRRFYRLRITFPRASRPIPKLTRPTRTSREETEAQRKQYPSILHSGWLFPSMFWLPCKTLDRALYPAMHFRKRRTHAHTRLVCASALPPKAPASGHSRPFGVDSMLPSNTGTPSRVLVPSCDVHRWSKQSWVDCRIGPCISELFAAHMAYGPLQVPLHLTPPAYAYLVLLQGPSRLEY